MCVLFICAFSFLCSDVYIQSFTAVLVVGAHNESLMATNLTNILLVNNSISQHTVIVTICVLFPGNKWRSDCI